MGTLREEILGSDDLRFEDVEVPEWKGRKVRLQELSADQLAAYQEELADAREGRGGKENAVSEAVLFLRYALCDPETREPIFGAEDLKALGRRSPRVLLRLFRRATPLSSVTEKELAAEGKGSGGPPPA